MVLRILGAYLLARTDARRRRRAPYSTPAPRPERQLTRRSGETVLLPPLRRSLPRQPALVLRRVASAARCPCLRTLNPSYG